MTKSLDKKIQSLPKGRQKRIKVRAKELVSLEMTLRQLRKNNEITQEQLAEILGIGQDSVSRLEARTDLKLSSLQNYVEALGGKLRILAEFPDTEPIEVSGLGENE